MSKDKMIHFKSGATLQINNALFEQLIKDIERCGINQVQIVRDEDVIQGESEGRPNRFINVNEIEFID
jgi:hypothetical protein